MEQQIQRTITSEHELNVDGQWFTEKKNSEELQDVVHTIHSQKIGDEKINVKQTIDGNLIEEPTIETSKDLDIASFKTDWQSGWNPKLGQKSEPTGFFSTWNIEDFINLVTVIILLALLIYVFYLYPNPITDLFVITFLLHIPFFIHFIYLREIE